MRQVFQLLNDRDAPPVAEQPVVIVKSWRLFQAENGDQHPSIALDHGPLRITSPIVGFNPVSAELTTQSGRRYQLVGPPEVRRLQVEQLVAMGAHAGLIDPVDLSDSQWQLVVKQ